MPQWTNKDERQYEHIKDNGLERGQTEEVAKEVAARTVNKNRREEGRTPNKTTQGTGNSNESLEDRSVPELRNRASQLNLTGHSKMSKAELIQVIRKSNT